MKQLVKMDPNQKFPDYAKCGGENGTAMVLSDIKSDMAHYYRPNGAWGIDAKWIDGKLITQNAPYPHLENLTFIEISKEVFDKEDGFGDLPFGTIKIPNCPFCKGRVTYTELDESIRQPDRIACTGECSFEMLGDGFRETINWYLEGFAKAIGNSIPY